MPHAKPAQGLTETLRGLARIDADPEPQDGVDGDRVSLAQIVAGLDDRARGVLIILFALPNCLPSLPGTSAVTGLPLVFLTIQMALGRPPWLPGFLARRSVSRAGLADAVDKAAPWLARIERLIHPRLEVLSSDAVERVIGLLGVFLSLTIMLPIPLGNMVPAIALLVFSLGLIGKDGLWVLGGLVITGLATALLAVAGWAAFQAVVHVWLGWFGV